MMTISEIGVACLLMSPGFIVIAILALAVWAISNYVLKNKVVSRIAKQCTFGFVYYSALSGVIGTIVIWLSR